jgi:4-amino-4-deoxy-L-arabinose transferase-like glycosyltransferase
VRGHPTLAETAAIGLIAAIALALRLWNVADLAASDPFFAHPSVDESMYDQWAQQIAAGDWRGDQVFLNGPLYPYLLGGLYAVVGRSLYAARAAQAVIGALACVLTWWIGRRRFTPAVALGAAALVAVSRMLIFYDSVLVADALMVPLALLTVAAAIAATDRPSAPRWIGVGVASGLGALARPNLLLVGVICAVWESLRRRDRSLGARAGWLAAFALGALACIAPVAWRNYAVSGDFVPITYSGGMNLFLGNNPDADGTFRVPRLFARSAADDPWEQRAEFERIAEQSLGRALRPSEVSRFWSQQALRFAREYPAHEARLLWHKFELATNAFEPWNIRSAAMTREFSRVLQLPLVGFGLLAPLGLTGLALTATRWRELVPLYSVLATVLATLLVFFVLARYRLPAVPVLALLACAAIGEAAARLRTREPRALAAVALAGLGAALAGAWMHRVVVRDDLSIAYYNLGNRYREIADWPRAIESYRRVIAARPNYISAYNNLALVYEATGTHDAEARATWEHVRELGVAERLPQYAERAERHLRALSEFGAGRPE